MKDSKSDKTEGMIDRAAGKIMRLNRDQVEDLEAALGEAQQLVEGHAFLKILHADHRVQVFDAHGHPP